MQCLPVEVHAERQIKALAQQLLCQLPASTEAMNNPRYMRTNLLFLPEQFFPGFHAMDDKRLAGLLCQSCLPRKDLRLNGWWCSCHAVYPCLADSHHPRVRGCRLQTIELPAQCITIGNIPRMNADRIPPFGKGSPVGFFPDNPVRNLYTPCRIRCGMMRMYVIVSHNLTGRGRIRFRPTDGSEEYVLVQDKDPSRDHVSSMPERHTPNRRV